MSLRPPGLDANIPGLNLNDAGGAAQAGLKMWSEVAQFLNSLKPGQQGQKPQLDLANIGNIFEKVLKGPSQNG